MELKTEVNNETLQGVIHDAAIILASRLRPQLLELEHAGKNLKAEIARVKEAHQRDVQFYLEEIGGLKEANKTLLLERAAEFMARPPEHVHDPDDPQPVITLDLDGTIKPQVKRGDGGNYPLTDKYGTPFSNVKKWLDRWSSRKACIHLATAGLPTAKADMDIFMARHAMLLSWKSEWGLPIQLFISKVGADIYYDDRMIVVPGDPSMAKNEGKIITPDWDLVGMLVEKDLAKRFDLIDGTYVRKEKKRVGIEIEEWPDIKDLLPDAPRGFSGPRLDVDMHRTLSLASSSMRVAAPRPFARDIISELYRIGVTIHISCAGWNPKTHEFGEWQRRLAGIRLWLQQNSIPYDRIVSKDHADCYIDDKGFRYTDWQADRSGIMRRLPVDEAYRWDKVA